MSLPFSQACENNRQYILDKLLTLFPDGSTVLEIGTLTAQHVTFFASAMPSVYWIPSDLPENLPTVIAGLSQSQAGNISAPLALDVAQEPWPIGPVDGIFTANTLHIMRYEYVRQFFRGAGRVVREGGMLVVYGPFKYDGDFTTPSNASFDGWLRQRDPLSGVRDFEQVQAWASDESFALLADHDMPANKSMLVWRKKRPDDQGRQARPPNNRINMPNAAGARDQGRKCPNVKESTPAGEIKNTPSATNRRGFGPGFN